MAARVLFCPSSSLPGNGGFLGRRRSSSSSSRRIRALDGVGDDEIARGMSEELDKLLCGEESKSLLRDLSEAARRLEAAKREKENLDNAATMSDDQELRAQERLAEECEQDLIAAQAELKAAEIALIIARSGGASKWESLDDAERMESGRAALVSGLAGTLASLPLFLSRESTTLVVSEALVLLSCAVFGVTYRYIVRRDFGNLQLKSGAAGGFALVRALGQVEAMQLSWTSPDYELAANFFGQSVVIFLAAALALDFCMKLELIQPFGQKRKISFYT